MPTPTSPVTSSTRGWPSAASAAAVRARSRSACRPTSAVRDRARMRPLLVGIGERPPARAHEASHRAALVASPCCRHGTSLTPHRPRRVASPHPRGYQVSSGSSQDGDRLLDGPAGAGEAPLVDGQLGAAGVDRLPQPRDGQVGQLLGDAPRAGRRMSSNSPAIGHLATPMASATSSNGWRTSSAGGGEVHGAARVGAGHHRRAAADDGRDLAVADRRRPGRGAAPRRRRPRRSTGPRRRARRRSA